MFNDCKHGMTVNFQKCQIGIDFVGHAIDAQDIRPLKSGSHPKLLRTDCSQEIRYVQRQSIPNSVSLMRPNQLRENAKLISLDDNTKQAFSTVKGRVTKAVMLPHQRITPPIDIAVNRYDSANTKVIQQWVNTVARHSVMA